MKCIVIIYIRGKQGLFVGSKEEKCPMKKESGQKRKNDVE